MTRHLKGVSIVICCYNSANRLPATLKYIAEQKLSSEILCEVIIVDNASTDNTSEIASTYWQSLHCHIPFKIINEPRPGKKYALETGFRLSVFNYILICDDDNWLDTNYVQIAYEIMQSDERIGALGGISEAVCEINPPAWFEKSKVHYAVGPQSSTNGDITHLEGRLYGAGMIVNKEAWLTVERNNYEYFLTCRKGDSLSSGGDLEMCYVFKMLGFKIYYDERLCFKHYIPKQRLTWNYLVKLFPKFAEAEVFLNCFKHFETKFYDNQSDLKLIYWNTLKEISNRMMVKKKDILILYLKGIPQGKRSYLFLKFSLVQLRFLLLQKKEYLNYLKYLNDFKKALIQRNQLTCSNLKSDVN